MSVFADTVRFVTYLAPSIPVAFYQGLADLVGRALKVDTSLVADARRSGPQPDGDDPFTGGEADVGFMCAPCYLELCGGARPAVLFEALRDQLRVRVELAVLLAERLSLARPTGATDERAGTAALASGTGLKPVVGLRHGSRSKQRESQALGERVTFGA